MLCKVNSKLKHCSVSCQQLLPEFDIPEQLLQLINWSLKCQCVERPNLQGISCRPNVSVWNDLLYIVLDTGTLDGFKGSVNRWLLP